jgi:transcription-repair coupling factor (superfamily II helicase)
MLDLNKSRFAGLSGSANAWLLSCLAKRSEQALIVCSTETAAEKLFGDLKFFLGSNSGIFKFPALDTLPFDAVSPQSDILAARIKCLDSLSRNNAKIIVTSAAAIAQRVISPEVLNRLSITLGKGESTTRDSLKHRLLVAGFKVVSLVEEIGEIAVRGNVIDIFSPGYPQPIRCEIHDHQITSLKFFNPETQRSEEPIDSVKILPIKEFNGVLGSRADEDSASRLIKSIKQRGGQLEVPPREIEVWVDAIKNQVALPGIDLLAPYVNGTGVSLFNYLKSEAKLILSDTIGINIELDSFFRIIAERHLRFVTEQRLIPEVSDLYFAPSEIDLKLKQFRLIISDPVSPIESLEESPELAHSLSNIDVATRLKSKAGSGEAFTPLVESISHWRHEGMKVAFIVGTPLRAQRLAKILLNYGILAEPYDGTGLNWIDDSHAPAISILQGSLEEGFRLPARGVALISESEIFFERTVRAAPSKVRSIKKFMSALAQLSEGDYLVHADYGVGIYQGLVHIEVEHKGRDFLHIEYAGGTKLFLPVENIGKVQKFVSKDGAKPVLDKLGSPKWEAKKAKVRQAVVALAGALIKLYAARKIVRGWRFDPPGAEDERFADGFGFVETPDQLRAIQDTFADLTSDRPMDRLVCGDAGFGKTEVALRAAFKCVQHARQVAVLVPTTILAEQHYNVFKNRFLEYPVKVGILSRFYSAKQNAVTLAGVKSGEIDIVVGTHKLLQESVEFKDLGLLIVDEEHRFGVKHKERLKQIKKDVDVLTLTATPIPRTLHMALLGIREISVIATPPNDRRVIRTYVGTQSDDLIREAILREIQRGGQVFILHNKVQTIDTVAASLQKLVPEAKFTFAHGQMREDHLEKIMLRFINKEFDVLVSTTIIESGLDIPNANTIIILRADQLGLAQLYQLRGRVGRSNKQAYAYLIVPEPKKLSEDARSRLSVLQSLDDLGLGFNLAARDLEIRGAGNLLGKDQSGNVQTVGLDMFNRILKEAILNMRGEELPIVESVDPEMRIPVDAYIPPDYVPDLSERLILYQRLADLLTDTSSWDLSTEIEDRFGVMPQPVSQLMQLMRLRSLIRLGGVVRMEFIPKTIILHFTPKAPISREKLQQALSNQRDRLVQKSPLSFHLKIEAETIDNPADLIAPIKQLLQSIIQDFPNW